MTKKMVDGVIVDYTPQEEADHIAYVAKKEALKSEPKPPSVAEKLADFESRIAALEGK